MTARKWKFVGKGEASGQIFRVVDAAKKEIIAFTEVGNALGNGYTWRGTATEFKKRFTMIQGP